ncbi:MAG: tetratricopeptide repeat protein [Verrucomicrobia bacterium]|nr:tetratricopeptide repeat protein [Verrucomicrobiota bacterium]
MRVEALAGSANKKYNAVTLKSVGRHHARAYFFAVLLAAVALTAYHPAWRGGFIWDDDAYVVNNDLLTASDGLRRIWFSLDAPSQYFPLVYTTFRFERALWGLNPLGYHLINICLHITTALLLWRLLARLQIPGAFLASAIFALHPVQVESVAWITERKNVLMGMFFMLTLLAWWKFVNSSSRRRWWIYAGALLFYALALFSKTTACTLPAALVLILWLKHRRIDKQRLLEIIPFVVFGVAMGLVTMWWERYHQGTRGPLFALGLQERLLVASHAVWFYLGKLLWPANLTFIYPKWQLTPVRLVSYLWCLASALACLVIYLLRRHFGRSLEVAALFFVATLGPVLGFIMLYTFRYTFVADHYQYLASIGPITLASAGIATFARRFRRFRVVTALSTIILVGLLALLTWRQAGMYSDIEALWRTTIQRNPGCWMAQNNLGIVLLGRGDIQHARGYFEQAVAMAPHDPESNYNLGNALLQEGDANAAAIYSAKAVSFAPRDAEARLALGNALLRKGLISDAIASYRQALQLRPGYFAAEDNLSNALLQAGDFDEAIKESRIALRLRPRDVNAHINLAIALTETRNTAQAIASYEQAIAISPDSVIASNNLAWLLLSTPGANRARALPLALHANQLSGESNPIVLRTVAAAYATLGNFKEAVETAEKARSLAGADGSGELAAELDRDIVSYKHGSSGAPDQSK